MTRYQEEYPISVVREARRLRSEGLSNSEITQRLGITDYTVRRWLGLQPGVKPKPHHDEALHSRARYLRECGQSITEISEELGLPRSTVGGWVRGMGCYGRATD